MKVLWVTNIIFPEVCEKLGIVKPISGGWLYSQAKCISAESNIELIVASPYKGKEYKSLIKDDVHYILLPALNNNYFDEKLIPIWKHICNKYNPDIIHLFGTEYPHGLACMIACPNKKYLVTMQGIIGVIAKYYYGGISIMELAKHTNIIELIMKKSLFHQRKNIIQRCLYEKYIINNANAITGRTTWDYAHVNYINTNVKYYQLNEILRDQFYLSRKWDINKINKHSLFITSGSSPIKGLHKLIQAIYLLKNKYPDIKLNIGGVSINNYSLYDKIKLGSYNRYILELINKLELENNINFTGPLDEKHIIEYYLNSNVYVCPSIIENSSNSIAEAQILGVPTIASDVGGTADLVEHCKTGYLYRFEEIELLAYYIDFIFSHFDTAIKISENEIEIAENRHNKKSITNQLMQIYQLVISY